MFKIEVNDDNGVWSDVRSADSYSSRKRIYQSVWSDVRGADGTILTFENEDDARVKLMELYPVMVQMEKYAGGKHTRVVRVFRTDDEWKYGTPPS